MWIHSGGRISGIISYFGIERIDDNYTAMIGRMMDEDGAHTKGMNHASIGVCFVGNFDIAPPDPLAWDLGVRLVRTLQHVLDIPKLCVVGHRYFASHKTCPGTMFDMDQFREEL